MEKPAGVIRPSRECLHGQFSRELAPVLTVASGSTVEFSTLDVSWRSGPSERFPFEDCERDRGPALHGPVAVRGALPGQVLEILIESVEPGPWGWNTGGGPGFLQRSLNRALGVSDQEVCRLSWELRAGEGVCEGHRVRLRPFLGVMGMPEDVPGWQNGFHPRSTGGNMDCRELVAGSTLFLPIAVPGGLLSVGDAHALQSDGESGGTGIECAATSRLRLTVRSDMSLGGPLIRTASGWVTLGFGRSLDEASVAALSAMLSWMSERRGWSRSRALAMASLRVDLRVTQIVNEVVGVHALWEDE